MERERNELFSEKVTTRNAAAFEKVVEFMTKVGQPTEQ
jgi:hypothetical protein